MSKENPSIILPAPYDGVVSINLPDGEYFGTMRLGDEEIKVYLSEIQQNTSYDYDRDESGVVKRNYYSTRIFTIIEAK